MTKEILNSFIVDLRVNYKVVRMKTLLIFILLVSPAYADMKIVAVSKEGTFYVDTQTFIAARNIVTTEVFFTRKENTGSWMSTKSSFKFDCINGMSKIEKITLYQHRFAEGAILEVDETPGGWEVGGFDSVKNEINEVVCKIAKQ